MMPAPRTIATTAATRVAAMWPPRFGVVMVMSVAIVGQGVSGLHSALSGRAPCTGVRASAPARWVSSGRG